jgi:hypothetical protein
MQDVADSMVSLSGPDPLRPRLTVRSTAGFMPRAMPREAAKGKEGRGYEDAYAK